MIGLLSYGCARIIYQTNPSGNYSTELYSRLQNRLPSKALRVFLSATLDGLPCLTQLNGKQGWLLWHYQSGDLMSCAIGTSYSVSWVPEAVKEQGLAVTHPSPGSPGVARRTFNQLILHLHRYHCAPFNWHTLPEFMQFETSKRRGSEGGRWSERVGALPGFLNFQVVACSLCPLHAASDGGAGN